MANGDYTSRQERRRQKKRKSAGRQWPLWKKILLSLCIVFLLTMIGGGIATAVIIHNAPELKASKLNAPISTRIYDQDGKLVSTLFHKNKRIKVHIENVPEKMRAAVVSIEDKRFRDHHGLDFRRIGGAVIANIRQGWGAEGGSTITQQVIKRTMLSPEQTLTRKIQEAWLALKLERQYSKDQILEMYLNNVYFGHSAYGLKTAAKTYFNKKDLSQLNISQMALLAGLPNSPSADDPFKHPKRAKERRNQVLTAMANNDAITPEQAKKAKTKSISNLLVKKEKEEKDTDPYNAFVDTVYHQLVEQKNLISKEQFFQGGLKIYTTLDAEAQKSIYHMIRSDKFGYPDENFETGLSLVDTKTGAVRAVGGGRHFKSIHYTNYGSDVAHQPGSTIKPILDYGPAIENLKWSTAHTLVDESYNYSDGTSISEWDNEYWGAMSIRRALAWSRNIPAFKAFEAVGKDQAQAFASDLGINIDPIHESAALGGFDGVSPLQMAAAYAAFGNGGTYHQPHTVRKITFPSGKDVKPETKSDVVMEDYTAYMMTDILKTVMDRGTGTKANIAGLPVAGKTGTTNIPKDFKEEYGIHDGVRDSWFTGYTTQYALSVWTGYPSLTDDDDNAQYIHDGPEHDIAQRLFKNVMSDVSSSNTADFKKPDSVVSSGSALYVKGAQPSQGVPSGESETPETDKQDENNDSDDNKDEKRKKDKEDKKDQSKEDMQEDNKDQTKEDSKKDHQSNDENDQKDPSKPNNQNEDNQKPDQGQDNEQGNGEQSGQNEEQGQEQDQPSEQNDNTGDGEGNEENEDEPKDSGDKGGDNSNGGDDKKNNNNNENGQGNNNSENDHPANDGKSNKQEGD